MPKSSEELFAAALELTNPAERAALLDRECTGNPALRAEVESLLAANEQANTFLNKSTVINLHNVGYRFWYAPRIDAPPLPLPGLRAPAPDSIWVTASKLKNTVQRAGANP